MLEQVPPDRKVARRMRTTWRDVFHSREQDWLGLRAEDVVATYEENNIIKVALLLGREHRGERVETGREQGVTVEDGCLTRQNQSKTNHKSHQTRTRARDHHPERRATHLRARCIGQKSHCSNF